MRKPTILVVEDERLVARDLQIALERAGYDVPVMAASGEEAILEAERLRPDLALMDIVLQGQVDGVAAADRIWRDWGIPVLYLSANGDRASMDRARKTEPLGYILKPFEEKDLLENVKVALQQVEAHRVREETTLLAAESRFRSIFYALPLGIAVLNRQGRCLESNPALQRILGYEAQEVGRLRLIAQAGPGENGGEEELHRQLIDGERNEYELERQMARKDGQSIWVRVRASVFQAGETEGELVRFTLHTFEDITETRRRQEAVLRARHMAAIGSLSAGLAHHLNNILTPVTVGLDLAQPLFKDESSRGLLRMMEISLNRGCGLSRQLLGLGGRAEEHFAEVDLGQVLGEVHAAVRETLPSTVTTEVRVPNGLCQVEGDANQLHQALVNLCANARDAMPAGGRLGLTAGNVQVEASVARLYPQVQAGAHVCLTIRDTGCGMSPETMEQIFSPFFTTKGVGKGTGLGLCNTLGIVRRHEGYIEVDSEPGKGTEFRLYLPVANRCSQAP
jgi:PAS domain S-box-containing protein